MTSFRGFTWLGVSLAAVAMALGGGCRTEDKLAVIPCNMQEHCTPHGLFCDLQVGQCALCTSDAGNCGQVSSGGAAGSSGSQGGSGPGNGGTSTDGGSNPSGGNVGSGGDGSGGLGSGGLGSGGDAGSGTTGGSAGTGAGGSAGGGPCSPVTGAAQDLIIYNGFSCNDQLNAPRTGHWFAFNDGTGLQNPAADQIHNGVTNGMAGGSDCMMRTQGAGFTSWGGSVKFWINASGGQICTYDATNYQGIRFYMRGTSTGTSGVGFIAADNTVRVNIPTQSTSSSGQGGTCVAGTYPCDDSYGKWCTVSASWALCELPFGSITQVGWGTAALFSKSEILGLQIQASRLEAAASVSWDIYIDDVMFY